MPHVTAPGDSPDATKLSKRATPIHDRMRARATLTAPDLFRPEEPLRDDATGNRRGQRPVSALRELANARAQCSKEQARLDEDRARLDLDRAEFNQILTELKPALMEAASQQAEVEQRSTEGGIQTRSNTTTRYAALAAALYHTPASHRSTVRAPPRSTGLVTRCTQGRKGGVGLASLSFVCSLSQHLHLHARLQQHARRWASPRPRGRCGRPHHGRPSDEATWRGTDGGRPRVITTPPAHAARADAGACHSRMRSALYRSRSRSRSRSYSRNLLAC